MILNLGEITKNCARTLLIVLNGFCVLIAICTFVFAVADTKILKQYGEEQAAGTFVGDMIIIAVCVVLVAVATFGTVGAMKGDAKFLYMYAGFLMILVISEVLISIYVSVQRFGLEFKVTEWIREDFFRNVTDDDKLQHTKLWDNLQTAYECCGLNGPEDYHAVMKPISLSCCPRAYRAKTLYARQELYQACIESSSFYSEGCEDEILYVLRSDAEWLLGVAFASFWFEAAGMLLAMYVANRMKNEVHVFKQTMRF